jgi:excisionase family DNA binding protein
MKNALFTVKDACQYLTMSKRTLERLGEDGSGPRRIKLSPRRVAYPKEDLDRWISERQSAAFKSNRH